MLCSAWVSTSASTDATQWIISPKTHKAMYIALRLASRCPEWHGRKRRKCEMRRFFQHRQNVRKRLEKAYAKRYGWLTSQEHNAQPEQGIDFGLFDGFAKE